MTEAQIREQVKRQKRLYSYGLDVLILNIAILFMWLIFDTESGFWPKYVMFVSILAVGFKAYHYNLFPMFAEKFESVKDTFNEQAQKWEEQKVKSLIKHKRENGDKAASVKSQKKIEARTEKKPAAKTVTKPTKKPKK